jgi:predicted acetyltransferase/RimJ/RimL family protein N-acetyltransferase
MSLPAADLGDALLRPLTAEDAPAYRALMLQAYADDADAFTSTPQERAAEPLSWWVERIAGRHGVAFGAFLGGTLVGTAALEFSAKPKTAHKALLLGMFVQPHARGRGLGRGLVQAALQAAAARPGVRVVTLTLTEGNAAALRLYRACGFREFGVEPQAIATPGGLRAKVHMTQALATPADAAPRISFRVATWEDRPVLSRLLELYQYDLSDVWPQHLNRHGEYGFAVDRYLRNPLLRAYLAQVDGRHAGFGLVDPDVSLPGNQLWMGQFFVMKAYRRLGVGRLLARHIFDAQRGRWEVGQMPLNLPAQAFWRRVIGEYTQGRYVEHELHDDRWDGVLQCFDNTLPPAGGGAA